MSFPLPIVLHEFTARDADAPKVQHPSLRVAPIAKTAAALCRIDALATAGMRMLHTPYTPPRSQHFRSAPTASAFARTQHADPALTAP